MKKEEMINKCADLLQSAKALMNDKKNYRAVTITASDKDVMLNITEQ